MTPDTLVLPNYSVVLPRDMKTTREESEEIMEPTIQKRHEDTERGLSALSIVQHEISFFNYSYPANGENNYCIRQV